MSSRIRGALAVVVSTVLLVGVVGLSRVSMSTGAGAFSVLRLSWGLLPERIEECRTLSEEELASRPAHMRQAEVCEGTTLPYRLTVRVDGRLRVDELMVGGGARNDRRVYVLREFNLPPGDHPISVSYAIEDSTLVAGEVNGTPPDERFAPRSMYWSGVLNFTAGQVVMITFDRERRQLRPRRSLPQP